MMFNSPKKHFTSIGSLNHGNSNNSYLNAHNMNAFILKMEKFLLTLFLDDWIFDKLGLKFWDVTNLPPLNKILSRDLQEN